MDEADIKSGTIGTMVPDLMSASSISIIYNIISII